MASVKFDYSGTHVLVTGGTSGIGGGIAAAYREAGADVTITGTRKSAAEYDTDLTGYRYLQLDVENKDSVAAVAGAMTRLDVLVNNAGIAFPSQGLDEYEPEIFARAIEMHLTSGYRMAHGCRDALSKSTIAGGGSIIAIGSMSSLFGMEIVPGYGSAKTGVVGLTRALAVAWGKRNIRVNAVAVGLTFSRMNEATFANPAWTEPTLARTPAGRLGQPEDVAGAVLFLTSPAASWITGQTLPIDGGYSVMG